jgi:hypothetical protein
MTMRVVAVRNDGISFNEEEGKGKNNAYYSC